MDISSRAVLLIQTIKFGVYRPDSGSYGDGLVIQFVRCPNQAKPSRTLNSTWHREIGVVGPLTFFPFPFSLFFIPPFLFHVPSFLVSFFLSFILSFLFLLSLFSFSSFSSSFVLPFLLSFFCFLPLLLSFLSFVFLFAT